MKSATGYTFHGYRIPPHMGEALDAYIAEGRPVGNFLEAVIANDLLDAVTRADNGNLANLPAFMGWLYNEAPRSAWGSRERYDAWLAAKMIARSVIAQAAQSKP
jgi:hypothetical protein